MEEAKDRVGRNDRLSQGSGEWREEMKQPRTEWAGMTD